MLSKNQLHIIYGILGAILVGVLSYNIGYESKHSPVYISIDKQRATKVMLDVGVTDEQIQQIFERMKNKR